MSTNYYLIEETNRCAHCGRSDTKRLHIGKSAAGWAFLFELHKDEGINSFADWRERILGGTSGTIEDQYGQQYVAEEMLDVVNNRAGMPEDLRSPYGYDSWAEFHERNHSYRGPNNLLFSTWYVVESGETWQCSNREFS